MEKINLFDNFLQVELPDDFLDMPFEMLQSKFPNEPRPQIIKGAADGSYATFSLLERLLSKKELFTAAHKIRLFMQKFYPDCYNQRVHVIPLEDGMCGWFSFLIQDKKIRNVIFIVAINGKILLGTCGCPANDQNRSNEIRKIFLSVKSLHKKQEEIM